MSTQPIGIFDSGIGGTSIFKEIHELLPHENTIYLADSKNAPYGNKSQDEILQLSIKNTELLLHRNCKLIVVACNTATTNAIDYLRLNYGVPIIGIEPAIKPAALNTKTKAIGILATKGTLSSALFHKTTDLYKRDIAVIEQVGDGIVPLIEAGKTDTIEMKALLERYLKPMVAANIDYLVLGCTHYPYLIPMLSNLLPKEVTIIDSGRAVAKQTKSVLEQYGLFNTTSVTAKNHFYTNTNTEVLRHILDNNHAIVEVLDF
ncbi:glutamate racemase [Subsaximicrobium wynnwilliamsii]|uniref:Glutamate racemase n=1 Tax=Subsaximicrobium wynnwilliamsii TaxID=291179 RepID=A0A5C6ZCV7_9FLAO|nr:glutamate racemase [Subsaximicrobium wynnwilliamsii]TXD82269.1 glutamate racemase [Subsaximicrobium wynnwilliamsii]TXD87907.1 glutamate racemase [Subsaximicrobium wynnwilliamsii]TXE01900.1 glutamate racemase [Subsaximicrobium wynnwilliamsii]